jgi:hypothetical protein
MEQYLDAIDRLKSYDLSKVSYDVVKHDIGLLAQFGCMGMVLHQGKSIIRARPNDDESPFTTRRALQYVPAEKNKRFARASSPYNTMFYGAVIPDEANKSDYDNSRVTATIEVSKILRPHSGVIEGEEKVTYSKWIVTQDIPLLAMCYHSDFITNSPHTADLHRLYQQFLGSIPKELAEKSIAVTDFLAHEFAKENPFDKEDEYKISAAFTQMAVKKGIAGIYYPSVPAFGKGFNVAIHPDFVDSCLQLAVVGECTIYKYPEDIIVDNDTLCVVADDTIPFTLSSITNDDHMGKDKVIENIQHYRNYPTRSSL